MNFVKYILAIALVVGLTGISGAVPILNDRGSGPEDTFAGLYSYGWYTNSGSLLGVISGNNNNNNIEALEGWIEEKTGDSLELTKTTVSITNYNASGEIITGASNTGTWEVTPAGNTISFYAVKAGNHYAVYEEDPAQGDGSWSTYDLWKYGQDHDINGLGGNGGLEVSHFTGYDPGTTPVPEPSTMLLLGTGILGLVTFGRKRLNKKV